MLPRAALKYLSLLLSVLLLFVSALPAQAQESDAPGRDPAPLAESLGGTAKQEYEAARILFDDGDFSGAIAKFKRAYELSGDPRLLWNQAVCEKELRHYARSAELIRRYLAEGADLLELQKKDEVERILDSLKRFSSRVVFSGVPAGASLRIDGEPVGVMPLPGPLVLDLGTHKVEITFPGYRNWIREVDIPGSAPVNVRVKLEPEAQLARLSIRSHRAASIQIDGSFVGEGRFEGALEPGTHTIVVSQKGKKTETRTIDLLSGGHRSLEVSLKESGKAGALPWILGGAILVGGAVATGFLMTQPGGFEGPTGTLGTIDARNR